ncbi:MAG TPA: NAD-dependent epimerase/dehydratase family protein [Acidimicrobiales bacterium]|nr:NAD-dependent epimerase/dehydratase family protein [Acidimicrobiales bacterium]
MRTVVTGGSGFIGSHVVERLVRAGHDVVVVDSRSHIPRPHAGADYVRVDILDLDGLSGAFAGADAVFHLAAMADVDIIAKDPVRATRVNVDGTGTVLEACRQVEVGRVVLASTVWVYGAAPGEGDIPEDAALAPDHVAHIYTAQKVAAEMLVHSYRAMYGLPFTILRYGIPYGPGMRDELVIARFIHQAMAGRPLTISGDGSQYRYYVYVEDLADAHVLALEPAAENQVLALEGREQVSIKRIAEAVAAQLGGTEVTYQPARVADFAARPVLARRAEELLGWTPSTAFEEGLRRCVEWYQEAGQGQRSAPPA